METPQDKNALIHNLYLRSKNQESTSKYFKSCISEVLLPTGLRGKLSLAMDVNNADLVEEIQNQMNIHGSKLLDIIVIQSQENEVTYKNYFEKASYDVRNLVGPNKFQKFMYQMEIRHNES